MNVLKAMYRGIVWTLKNLIWKPIVWTAKMVEVLSKPKKKPVFKTSSTLSNVQKAAAKDLPQLTKLLSELMIDKRKVGEKLSGINSEIKSAQHLIKAAGGDLGQYAVAANKQSNKQNRNKQQRNNDNNNNSANVNVADAEFATS